MGPRNGEGAGGLGQQLLGVRQHLLTPSQPGPQIDLPRLALLGSGDLAACAFEAPRSGRSPAALPACGERQLDGAAQLRLSEIVAPVAAEHVGQRPLDQLAVVAASD
ncbi:hypothetical protein LDDCCGHA_5790 [Methylobacterium oxalidis]|nr:hypothetical protein LDDCCGHA_5790 [Methylobacterium oxalidis]